MEKPKVDFIGGLSPAIAIEQKAVSKNPRSTVGTVTEISDYLRVLFARCRHALLLQLRPGGRALRRRRRSSINSLPRHRARGSCCWRPSPASARERTRISWPRHGPRAIPGPGSTAIVVDLAQKLRLAKNKKHDIELVVDRPRSHLDGAGGSAAAEEDQASVEFRSRLAEFGRDGAAGRAAGR